uniref:J protein JJJ1 n=1 Tax=Lygus hesperus TaxID=30085 RepID=A0A146LL18_LYGHE
MEDENRKIREQSRKEYNRKVASVVQFVQKSDPRWVKIQMQNQAELHKQRQEQRQEQHRINEDRRKQKERSRELLAKKLDDQAKHYYDVYGELPNSVQKLDDGHSKEFHCIPCNKVFKSENQLVNHERSSRHRKNLSLHSDSPTTLISN